MLPPQIWSDMSGMYLFSVLSYLLSIPGLYLFIFLDVQILCIVS